MRINLIDRYRGGFIGLAVGDSVGAAVEFQVPGTFAAVTDMIGGGVHDIEPGEWTDDTSMALCLAESLLESDGFDANDQMQRYLKWFREGYFSCRENSFGVGKMAEEALVQFEETGDPYSGLNNPEKAGNGSLMRLLPIALYYAGDVEQAIEYATKSSLTTHGATESIDACRLFAHVLVQTVRGVEKEKLFGETLWPHRHQLTEKVAEIAAGSYKTKEPPEIRASSYVVESLEAALWAFHRSTSFEEGLLMTVNLGDDADTTGAIYGQLAGVYYGMAGIPRRWREQLKKRSLIMRTADHIYMKSDRPLDQ
ncbi:ADP-ribosylglycohydrolase family protein [Numidum massiliense]|uniref:ADP-ribosylglycohydrolase family protein n=1 Tax=Numidum massiliense TaxID=1522315 RepID=UPI0021C30DDE|nr:ADP-ribosylglycohydrolase family protein [Numidum massiliense]